MCRNITSVVLTLSIALSRISATCIDDPLEVGNNFDDTSTALNIQRAYTLWVIVKYV